MTDTLVVMLSGRVAGRVERRASDRSLRLVYDDRYAAAARRAVPLSLSMPVQPRSYEDSRFNPHPAPGPGAARRVCCRRRST